MPVTLIAAVLFAAPAAGPALDKKVASVMPTATEDKWMEIPWRSNVLKAVLEAQESKKPLFFWVMNGNPLGAT